MPVPAPPPGLELISEIGRGADAAVFRAMSGGRFVTLKVLRRSADRAAAERFRRSAALMARVRHPALARVLELGETEGQPYVVLEHIDGAPLDVLIEDGPPPEEQVVAIGRRIAGALGALHRRGVVHRDVKPHNIVVDSAGEAHLIDLGLAARMPVDAPPGQVVGTLRYAPPEQTGALQRPVDERSDLYALGCTLFECATGRPPYEAGDAAELMRQHLAAPIPDPRARNRRVSPALARVLMRLIAKDPDDRYPSGRALIADLDRLPSLNAALDAGEEPRLGQFDDPADRVDPTPIFGRDAELSVLFDRWREARGGTGSAVIVTGPAGGGKSRLVRDMVGAVRASGGLTLAGKCAQGRTTPLAALREALDDWVGRVRRLPGPARASAEAAARRAAGDGAPLLRRFAPSLTAVLGPAAGPDDLDRAHDQFFEVLTDFLVRLAEVSGGALLFLDDVHWLDDSTRQVLRRLAPHLPHAPVLLVCSARDEPRAQVASLLEELAPALELPLRPLDEHAVARIVEDLLGGQPPESLARSIARRTAGNPLAVHEYLNAMLDGGALRPSTEGWRTDAEALASLDLPTDLLSLFARRVAEMGVEIVAVLATAAVVGARFSSEVLHQIVETAEGTVDRALREATADHLLSQIGPTEYAFVHDRVREALLAQWPAQTLRSLHARVAEVLEARTSDEPSHVYALAHHYARAGGAQHPRRVYETSLAAGLLAADTFGDQEAYDLLRQAEAAASLGGIDVGPDLYQTLGAVCQRIGRLGEAVAHFEHALSYPLHHLQRARIHGRIADIHVTTREIAPAWKHLRQAFVEAGATCPRPRLPDAVASLCWWLLGWLVGFRWTGYGGARGPARARLATLAFLYEVGGLLAYIDQSPLVILQMTMRSLYPAHRLGPSRELVTAYAGYALTLAVLGRRGWAKRAAARALAVAARLDDPFAAAKAALAQAWSHHVGGSPVEAEALMRRSLDDHGRWLDAQLYVVGCTDLGWNLLMRGYCREAWTWIQRAMHRADQVTRHQLSLATDAGALLAVMGQADEASAHFERAMRAAEETPGERWRWADLLGRRTLYHLERGELDDRVELTIQRRLVLGLKPGRSALHSRHFYVFQAYVRLAQAERASDGDFVEAVSRLWDAIGQLRRAASHPTLRAHLWVVEAGYLRLTGSARDAEKRLDEALRLSDRYDNPWAAFEATRLRARLLRSCGDDAAALRHARGALALAEEHGWQNRAGWVRDEFRLPASRADEADEGPSLPMLRYHLDALLSVTLAAGAVLDPEEQARIATREVARTFGAERAFLLYADSEDRPLRPRAGVDTLSGQPDLDGYSRSVVEAVRRSRRPVIVNGGADGPLDLSQSIVVHDLRSIVAVPLLAGEQLRGVLYLDSRLARGIFTPDQLAVLQAVASHIVLALQTAEAFAENARLLAVVRQQLGDLRLSRQRITAAEERLRREIAEMLHSRVQTQLLVAWHQLGGVEAALPDGSPLQATVAGVREQLDQVREREIRQASHLLHPSIIAFGVRPALEHLCDQFGDLFRVEMCVAPAVAELDGPIDNRLPEPVRLGLYRIVAEALQNVARHAGATAVRLELDLDPLDTLVLTLSDDGRGLDAESMRRGLGLTSIGDRVEQMDGTWAISSSPGGGFTLRVRVPLALASLAVPEAVG